VRVLLAVVSCLGAAPAPEAEAPPGYLAVVVGDCVLQAPITERGRLERLADDARTLLPRVEEELGARASAPYRITLVPPGPPGDERTRALDTMAPDWASGYMLPGQRVGAIRIALADRYPYADLSSVLAHEATHQILFDSAGPALPRWFGEGVATGVERGWGMRDVLVYTSSILTGPLPSLDELDAALDASDDRASAAYAASFDFMLWTVKTYGPDSVRRIVREAKDRPFPEAWRAATGVPLDRSEASWRRGSLLLYRWVPAVTGTTALWSGITLLALVAGARRRARSRRLLEEWRRDEEPPWPPEPGPEAGPEPEDTTPPDEVVH